MANIRSGPPWFLALFEELSNLISLGFDVEDEPHDENCMLVDDEVDLKRIDLLKRSGCCCCR
jgi:hypothetical protein